LPPLVFPALEQLYGNFLAKVKANPDIAISPPKTIRIPDTTKLLYVFEVAQSPRRPHLPSPADQRLFWKLQGSACVQMTLEEIRYQMNTYEEKLEKLTLLLIDLHHKVQSLNAQANVLDNNYNGDVFSFEIIDRVVVESYALLKSDVSIFGLLELIRSRLMSLNAAKQKLLTIMAMSYIDEFKNWQANEYRQTVRNVISEVTALVEQIGMFTQRQIRNRESIQDLGYSIPFHPRGARKKRRQGWAEHGNSGAA
jgi:hypothetical protein